MELFTKKIDVAKLTSAQKQVLQYQKISGILANYGYSTIRVTDNCFGFDFFARCLTEEKHIKIQLKGRLTFDKKYLGKDIYICFYENENWYIYPHDILLQEFIEEIKNTLSWSENGLYHFPYLTEKNIARLKKYKIIER